MRALSPGQAWDRYCLAKLRALQVPTVKNYLTALSAYAIWFPLFLKDGTDT